MARHQLTNEEWSRLVPLLPPERGSPGRPWNDHRQTVEAILWLLWSGAPWRDLPSTFGSWKSVYGRFNRWSRDGTWDRIQQALLQELDEAQALDFDLWFIDSTCVRATRAAAGAGSRHPPEEPTDHSLGRSRGGFSTKLHIICDAAGVPLAARVSQGQRHDSTTFIETMDAVQIPRRRGVPRRRPRRLGADKAYSIVWIRQWLRRRSIGAVIPTRVDQKRRRLDRAAYRRRNVVERCIGWMKEARRVATRYEKLALNFLGMVKLAMIRRILRTT